MILFNILTEKSHLYAIFHIFLSIFRQNIVINLFFMSTIDFHCVRFEIDHFNYKVKVYGDFLI